MRIIDISTPLSGKTIRYPGDPRTEVKTSIIAGFRVSTIYSCLHTGTHVDAPSHILKDSLTVDELPLASLIGRAKVIVAGRGALSAGKLQRIKITPQDILIIKCCKASSKISSYLTRDSAEHLVKSGVKAVGTDQLSLDANGSDAAHRTLLERGIPIIESLELSSVKPGVYTMVCLPLKVVGAEAAPARCILLCR
jgi:arylformamidase